MMNDQFGEIGTEAIRLLCGERRRVEISSIRRTLIDAILAWPGEMRERWWKWLVESGRGLSYGTRVIDASPREVFELLRHGVAAVTWDESSHPRLLVLTGARRGKFRVCELPENPAGRLVSPRELSKVLGGTRVTAMRRWVVLDPMTDDTPLAADNTDAAHAGGHNGQGGRKHAGHSHPSPWTRLWEFLRPEWSDIWIVFVYALVIGMLTLATPIAVEALVNTVAFGTLVQPLIVLSIILLTFLGFAAALRFLQKFVVELIQRRLFARVAARLAWQLPRVRLEHAREFTPELLNRFFDIVTMQKIVSQLLLDGLNVVLTIGLGMIVLAFYHPWLLAFDFILVALLTFNVFVLGRGAVRTSIAESKCKYDVAGWLEDIARCPTTFKSGGAAEFALSRADRLTTDYLTARQMHFRVLMRQIISGLALEALASAVLLGLGGFLVIQGQMTLGQLVAAELIVTMIVAAVAKFSKHQEGFYDLLTSMDKLGHLFDLPVEPSSGAMHVGRDGAAALSLKHVSFHFGDGVAGLHDFSLDVSPGEMVAVTGPGGCGKSTLVDLLFRLHEPSAGCIILDELDLRDLRPDVLRQNVALVRGMEILEGTLAENVHLDRPEITPTDVRAVLQRVGLGDVADPLRDEKSDSSSTTFVAWALDTPLTPDGKPLAESQTRRLMLARALVGRPRLLLIDGLLDAFADDDVRQLLRELRGASAACTVLIVTVRKEIAELCDRIVHLSPAAAASH